MVCIVATRGCLPRSPCCRSSPYSVAAQAFGHCCEVTSWFAVSFFSRQAARVCRPRMLSEL
eukprot:6876642-Prorocentrum_lima.AAC.1